MIAFLVVTMLAKIMTHGAPKRPRNGTGTTFYQKHVIDRYQNHVIGLHRFSVWASLLGLLAALAVLGLGDDVAPRCVEVSVRVVIFVAAIAVALILGVETARMKPGE
jgi:hypothetical protein